MKLIVSDPHILGGKPCVKDTRMSVEQILGMLGHGMSVEEIVQEYPLLTEEDVRGVLLYARDALQNDILIDVRSA